MHTYATLHTAHAVQIPDHLRGQVEVPVLAGMQRQGDLLVIPTTPPTDSGTLVPAEGVPVIRGEAGGNTHLLAGDGPLTWLPAPTVGQTLGTVTIPDGVTGYLMHPEHGYQGIAPGSYTIRRQREQADEIRYVAD